MDDLSTQPTSDEEEPLLAPAPSQDASTTKSFPKETEPEHTNPLDETLAKIGIGRYQIVLMVVCSMGQFGINAENAVSNLLEGNTSFMNAFHGSAQDFAIWSMATNLSYGIGAAIAGPISDQFGRNLFFLLSGFAFALSGFITPAATNFAGIIATRTVANVFSGILAAMSFVLMIEQVPVYFRGRSALIYGFTSHLGLLYASLIGLAMSFDTHATYSGVDVWRWYFIFNNIPLLAICFIALANNYESPRFLLAIGEVDRAFSILKSIASSSTNDDPVVTGIVPTRDELATYSIQLQEEENFENQSSMFQKLEAIFDKDRWFQTSMLCISFVFYFCAQSGLVAYNGFLFRGRGISVYTVMFASYSLAIVAYILAFWIFDNPAVNRLAFIRVCLAISVICSVPFILINYSDVMVLVIAYCVFIALWAPISLSFSLYCAEYYETNLRGTIFGLSLFAQTLTAIGTTYCFAELAASLDWRFGMLLATMLGVALVAAAGLQDSQSDEPLK